MNKGFSNINQNMRLVLIGPPGCGKGTAAKRISQTFNVEKISIGDLLREHITKKTGVGLKAKPYVDKGILVPDKIIIKIIETRIKRLEHQKKSWVIDGYPRSFEQARALERIAQPIAMLIDIGFEISKQRIILRRICPKCGAIYNLKTLKPRKDNLCDKCGVRLIQRKDDKLSRLKTRWRVYEQQTLQVVSQYDRFQRLIVIDGEQSIADMNKDIIKALKRSVRKVKNRKV